MAHGDTAGRARRRSCTRATTRPHGDRARGTHRSCPWSQEASITDTAAYRTAHAATVQAGRRSEVSPPRRFPGGDRRPGRSIQRTNVAARTDVQSAATIVDPQRTEGEPINFMGHGTATTGNPGRGATSTQANPASTVRPTAATSSTSTVPVGLRPDSAAGRRRHRRRRGRPGRTPTSSTWRGWSTSSTSVSERQRQQLAEEPGLRVPRHRRRPAVVRRGQRPDQRAGGRQHDLPRLPQGAVGTFIYSSPGSTGADRSGRRARLGRTRRRDAPLTLSSQTRPAASCASTESTGTSTTPASRATTYEITSAHVNPGQRTGIVYTNVSAAGRPGGGPVGDLFPAVATDDAGNVYAAWIDETDHNVYYSASIRPRQDVELARTRSTATTRTRTSSSGRRRARTGSSRSPGSAARRTGTATTSRRGTTTGRLRRRSSGSATSRDS